MSVLDKFKLDGKVAIVTGAGKNLGKVIALSLAEAGADVAVVSRTPSEIQKTARQIEDMGRKAIAIPMDVTDFSQVQKMVHTIASELGRIDILVNNAATRAFKSIIELPEEEWQKVIDTNLTGAFLCCKAVGPIMIRQGGGRIINISSRAGVRGRVDRTAYCASKGGLNQLTRALALEWAPNNILVNAVAPGKVKTVRPAERAREAEQRVKGIPLKRLGGLDEVTPLIVFLASEACSYITGEMILVDGGVAIQ